MDVDFSKIVHQNLLKFLENVTIIHMNLPMKQLGKCMHGYREKLKMVLGDGGQFLEKCAPKFVEMFWECYYHPYAFPLKQIGKWMHDIQDMPKIFFLLCVFLLLVAKQSLPIAF